MTPFRKQRSWPNCLPKRRCPTEAEARTVAKVLTYLRWLSRAVPRRRPATIFMFHSIGYQPTGCDVHSPEVFEAFLAWLVQRTRVVSIADYCAALGQPGGARSLS